MTESNPLREGLSRRKHPEPCSIILFGASGDLTRRKLVPALFHLARAGLLPSKYAIVGFARREKTDAEFRGEMLASLREKTPNLSEADGAWQQFASSIFYHVGSFDDEARYSALGARLDQVERSLGLPGNRLYYLAAGPGYFSTIVRLLGKAGLARPPAGTGKWARVIVEKPFGHDLASARALNAELLQVLQEDQIYRIDHYLGKETVQNLLAFRFANEIFEPLWNQKYVSHVQITVGETLGVEGRGGYYDRSGVVRDMIQNHMLQVLSLVAMEPPAVIDSSAIRNEKVKVLQAIRKITPADAPARAVFAQYGPGMVLGRAVPGYAREEGVPPDSRTPTYAALRLDIDSWRWAGAPFFLRSGKRLPKRSTEVCIQFRKPPLRLFDDAVACTVASNALIINIQPEEGISLRFGAKVPGPDMQVRQVKMDFGYGTSFGVPTPEAYERLILDALGGDSTLFTRRDEVEASWTAVTGILQWWEESKDRPYLYPAGSWGPQEAGRLFEGFEGSWRRL